MNGLKMDPRSLLAREAVKVEEIKVGDFVAARYWSRPRLVVAVDGSANGVRLVLAEPDESRVNEAGVRVLEGHELTRRGPFSRFPNLTAVWAASGAQVERESVCS